MTLIATIPFSGFYHAHEHEYEREIESLADHYASEFSDDILEWLVELAQDSADFESYCEGYAKEYAESFCDWLQIDAKFESMSSPREYNFETDRIFIEFTRSELASMWRRVDKPTLDRICKERFTSRDGFISHYSSDWRNWSTLSDWDHNQVGTLIQAIAVDRQGGDFTFWDEAELMESYMCNGGAHGDMWKGDKANRFWRIFNYMVERANRPNRTLAQWHAARRAENRPFNETPLGSWVAA